MSYILDALKKIEHEKNKKALPDGRISISGDLFQERKQSTGKAGVWKIVLLIAAASLVTSAVTWFVLKGNSKGSAVTRTSAPPKSIPVSPPVVATPVPVPVQPVAVPPAAQSTAVPVMPKSTEPVGDNESSAESVRRPNKRIQAQPAASKQPIQTVQAPADIKLSGIAWQDEHAARRAVINGFLLKEGAVVSGAKITDILADRVRFSSAAGQFEIKLDAVLPTEVK